MLLGLQKAQTREKEKVGSQVTNCERVLLFWGQDPNKQGNNAIGIKMDFVHRANYQSKWKAGKDNAISWRGDRG